MSNYDDEQAEYERLARKKLEFPLACLPAVIADMAEAVAKNLSVPVDLTVTYALGAISACVCGHLNVFVRDEWIEPCPLYLMPVVRSGGGKTPAFK